MLMMMNTITVHSMCSAYDDAATRAAAVSQSRYSEFSLLRHSLTISDFIVGHMVRAEYPSHNMVVSTRSLCKASAHNIRASEAGNFGDLQRAKVSKIDSDFQLSAR
jgi:hypothetical protein